MQLRPSSEDYPKYYETYVRLVPEGPIEETLRQQQKETMTFLKSISETETENAYAPGKWTIKEVVGHITDIERVMSYRLFAIARGEDKSLLGMDENVYVSSANFNQFGWERLITDLSTTRSSTLSLMTTIDDTSWVRKGAMLDVPVKPYALAYILAGHELHHLNIIKERYLK
ncbi:MAG TPA: DinB family protein [Candidatus Angelobacter sp.]|nr:DinB family protein [Candidatus Angelobacter sp.]